MKNFIQNPGESAREFALRFLLDRIINLEFEPGQKISDIEISKELNISRTPVREAILSLTNGHLIESYPQKGIFISLIDSDIVEQVCAMRKMIEGPLAEMSCDFITREHLDNLYDYITLQKDYASNGPRENYEKFLNLDIAFHKEFYNICGMNFIYDTMQTIMPHFDRQRKLSYQINVSDRVINDHTAICRAIEERDKKKASEAMVRHISTALADQTILKREFPNYYI
ncbi:GntR family transcriptional regulator [Lachnospiraceae bacterium 54-53]